MLHLMKVDTHGITFQSFAATRELALDALHQGFAKYRIPLYEVNGEVEHHQLPMGNWDRDQSVCLADMALIWSQSGDWEQTYSGIRRTPDKRTVWIVTHTDLTPGAGSRGEGDMFTQVFSTEHAARAHAADVAGSAFEAEGPCDPLEQAARAEILDTLAINLDEVEVADLFCLSIRSQIVEGLTPGGLS